MKKNINITALILAAFTLMLFGGIPAFAQGPGGRGGAAFRQPAAPHHAGAAIPARRAPEARPHQPAPETVLILRAQAPPASRHHHPAPPPAPIMRGQAPPAHHHHHHHPAPPPAYRPAPPPEPRPHGGLIQMILHSLVDTL